MKKGLRCEATYGAARRLRRFWIIAIKKVFYEAD